MTIRNPERQVIPPKIASPAKPRRDVLMICFAACAAFAIPAYPLCTLAMLSP
jgi:hypothetical protein